MQRPRRLQKTAITAESVKRGGRRKYRRKDEGPSKNIMFDDRVRRGRSGGLPSANSTTRSNTNRRRYARERTPEPVPGRKHMEIQTMNYLEELRAGPRESVQASQTDPLRDRPSKVLFVPRPSGPSVSIGTSDHPECTFDFDKEVEPILETLIGKTLEQAMLEVCHEEELRALRLHREQWEIQRNLELAQVQRIAERQRRVMEEKERRRKQQEEHRKQQAETQMRLAAARVAKEQLLNLEETTLRNLEQQGLCRDPVRVEVETLFMRGIVEEAQKAHQRAITAEQLVERAIREAVEQGLADVAERQTAKNARDQERRDATDLLARQTTECAQKQEQMAVIFKQWSGDADRLLQEVKTLLRVQDPELHVAPEDGELTEEQTAQNESTQAAHDERMAKINGDVVDVLKAGPMWQGVQSLMNMLPCEEVPEGPTAQRLEMITPWLEGAECERQEVVLVAMLKERADPPESLCALLGQLFGTDVPERPEPPAEDAEDGAEPAAAGPAQQFYTAVDQVTAGDAGAAKALDALLQGSAVEKAAHIMGFMAQVEADERKRAEEEAAAAAAAEAAEADNAE